MPRSQLPGGTNPFPSGPRPNVFQKLPTEEMFDRLGEPVIFLRSVPAPRPAVNVGQFDPIAQAGDSDGDGYLRTFQRELRIQELAQLQARRPGLLRMRYGPIVKVHDAHGFRTELQGGTIPLKVTGFTDNVIRYEARPDVPYWMQINVDYSIRLCRELSVDVEMREDSRLCELNWSADLIQDESGRIRNVCAGLKDVALALPGASFDPLPGCEHDFTRIYLPRYTPAGATVRATLMVYETLPVSYRSFNVRRDPGGRTGGEAGDLEAVFPPNMLVTEGDLIIFTNGFVTHQEPLSRMPGGEFRVKHQPLRSLEMIYALDEHGNAEEIDPGSAIQHGFQSFSLPDRPEIQSLSVSYTSMPQYRVKSPVEFSALAGRQQPRTHMLGPSSSSIVL